MSHKATYWLAMLDPSQVKSGAFRVLFHLCDHHNDERNPETACFPSQETLMRKTALSNGGLNKCLNDLEDSGLLTRKRSTIPGTSTRRTYYILGCDDADTTRQTPQSGDSPNSTAVEAVEGLTPLLEGANSTFRGGKLHPSGEEPVKELVIGKKDTPIVPNLSFEDFWAICPKKIGKGAASKAFSKAIKSVGSDAVFSGMQRHAADRDGEDPQYTPNPATWLNQERWTDQPTPKQSAKTDDFHNQFSKMLGGQPDGPQRTDEIDSQRTQRLSAPLQTPRSS